MLTINWGSRSSVNVSGCVALAAIAASLRASSGFWHGLHNVRAGGTAWAGWGTWCLSQALDIMVAKSSQTKDGSFRGHLYVCSEPSLWRLHSPVSTQVCSSPGSLGSEASAISPQGRPRSQQQGTSKSECSCRAGTGEEDHKGRPSRKGHGRAAPGVSARKPHEGRITREDLQGAPQERVSREHYRRCIQGAS